MSERTVGVYALAAGMLVHAAVHLVGFAKAFALADVAALSQPIPRALGALWLGAALLLTTTAVLVLTSAESWWVVGAVAVVLSELAIVTAWLFFDEEGKLVNFQSDDRYQSADGKVYARYRWSTPVHAYANFGGYRLTSRADAAWAMPSGELVYGRFELVSIEYNVSPP